ncbi:carboxypeptidase-like protein Ss [Xylogone sp. PMI_703]|nr:carboxypeptidase-like protein Ss [Xylogone sp. PMI_703]
MRAFTRLRGTTRAWPVASRSKNAYRTFTVHSLSRQRTVDMTEDQIGDLHINRDRLWEELHETCEFGKGERWGSSPTDIGMSRLALSDSDKEVRDWFVKTAEGSLGCKLQVDGEAINAFLVLLGLIERLEMGNMFAIRRGRKPGPPVYAGSHFDTQPTGGRYDGILGVHAGIEAIRTLNDKKIETEYDVGICVWTNEEGARFNISMMSSGVWAGYIPKEQAFDLVEVGGGTATVASELKRIGYLGPLGVSYKDNPMAAHFELHIEQGPILESTNAKIGAVVGVQSYRWHRIRVTGRDCHTGTTDFKNRSDALLTAAKLILHSHNKATEMGCLASTGILSLKPGSTNTVPGMVEFSLDIRNPDDGKVMQLEEALKGDFDRIAAGEVVDGINSQGTKGKGCTVSWKLDTSSPAVKFDKDCVQCIEDSAKSMLGSQAGVQVKRMTSGAGHDSVYTSKRAPTAMIFVPCKDGVSHNPAEYCSKEDCGNGAQVLLGAILRYDRLRAARGD